MYRQPNKRPALTLDTTIVQDDLPLEVIPKLFIGSIHCAFNSECLHTKNITHILNASRLPVTFPKLFTYLSVDIRDRDSANILSCIPTTNIFIEAGITGGGVLVHCFGGKSRSPAFVCAYLMSLFTWSYDQSYAIIKAVRPTIDINIGFERQLRAYSTANYDVYTAQQLLLRSRIRDLHLLRGNTSNDMIGLESSPSSEIDYMNGLKSSPQSNTTMAISRNKRSFVDAKTSSMITDIVGGNIDSKSLSSLNTEFGINVTDALTEDVILESIQNNNYNNTNTSYLHNDNQVSERNQAMNYTPVPLSLKHYAAFTTSNRHSSPDLQNNYQITNQNNNEEEVNGSSKSNDIHIEQSITNINRTSSIHHHRNILPINSKSTRNNRKTKSFSSTTEVDIHTPACRLSRPGTTWVRVIPPLRGLEREFKCSWCNATLFSLANVLRTDIDITHLLDNIKTTNCIDSKAQDKNSNIYNSLNTNHDCSTHNHNNSDYKSYSKEINHIEMKITSDHNNYINDGMDMEDDKSLHLSPQSSSSSSSSQQQQCYTTRGLASSKKSFDFISNYDNDDNNNTENINSQYKQPNHFSLAIPNVKIPITSQQQQQSHSKHPQLQQIQQYESNYYMDESPRIAIPPHRMIDDIHGSYRARSAEKQRWLARMSLLHDNNTSDGNKVAKMAEEDDNASQFAFIGQEKYFYIEYMDWMGRDVFDINKELGDIICFGCSKTLGKWSWKPSVRLTLNDKLEAPLFMIHKHVVHQMDLPFDATPGNTPRPDEYVTNMNY